MITLLSPLSCYGHQPLLHYVCLIIASLLATAWYQCCTDAVNLMHVAAAVASSRDAVVAAVYLLLHQTKSISHCYFAKERHCHCL